MKQWVSWRRLWLPLGLALGLLVSASACSPFGQPERLMVSASVSNAYPKQYSAVYVDVYVTDPQRIAVADAHVTATAYYRPFAA